MSRKVAQDPLETKLAKAKCKISYFQHQSTGHAKNWFAYWTDEYKRLSDMQQARIDRWYGKDSGPTLIDPPPQKFGRKKNVE